MRKKVWIINHYATDMFFDGGGRHYWFAECLKKKGYEPIIICASTIHNSIQSIDMGERDYLVDNSKDFPYIFIRTPKYEGNGKERMKNMYSFFKKIQKYSEEIRDTVGMPDIIFSSSVHPLTLVAGIRIGKKFKIPCICEVRDLWPLALIEYGLIKNKSLIAKLLYKGEKWIYKKADAVIMTIAGCKQYIMDMGWEKQIDINNVHYINNGIMLDNFDYNKDNYIFEDEDLNNKNNINIVYTGSIRKVNNLNVLLEAAILLRNTKYKNIKILVFGDGDEKDMLINKAKQIELDNILFKGQVDKKYVPYIVSQSYATILHYSTNELEKYGQSQNKLFDYMAAERPVLSTYNPNYNIVTKYDCGLSIEEQTPENIAKMIIDIVSNDARYKEFSANARAGAKDFDFNVLTNRLIKIIESI